MRGRRGRGSARLDRLDELVVGGAVTLDTLSWAARAAALGRPSEAIRVPATPAHVRHAGDRGGEAATLNNLGLVYDVWGDRQQALAYYNQALPIVREVGDRGGEAATLNNLGAV